MRILCMKVNSQQKVVALVEQLSLEKLKATIDYL